MTEIDLCQKTLNIILEINLCREYLTFPTSICAYPSCSN